ncbi:TPA: penicillin-binding transpeptidase domain-containing protein [Clostridioides difficile]
MRDDFLQVVESPNGRGHSAKIKGISIAGKTGTAEIKASKDDVTGAIQRSFFFIVEVMKRYFILYKKLNSGNN